MVIIPDEITDPEEVLGLILDYNGVFYVNTENSVYTNEYILEIKNETKRLFSENPIDQEIIDVLKTYNINLSKKGEK